jgi:uncharacterized protein YndB with AHSA1/START domain
MKFIMIVVAVIVAAVLILAAMRPDTFKVQREATIQAPPEKVYALISDFKAWPAWSPWEKKDPRMKRTFGAVTTGEKATYAWQGNKEVGEGRMEIAEAAPPSRVKIKLDFIKPFETHNVVDFTLQPKGKGTSVTWSMEGPTPFLFKIVHLFMDMDRMVGKDFEAGLANLKAAAEK